MGCFAAQQGQQKQLLGLLLLDKGVLRAHQKVSTAQGEGEITSGSFAPTLQQSIAPARLPLGVENRHGENNVDIRGKQLKARVLGVRLCPARPGVDSGDGGIMPIIRINPFTCNLAQGVFMNIPSNLKYTRMPMNGYVPKATAASRSASPITHRPCWDDLVIELPEVGKILEAEQEAAVVESVKAASDVYAPVVGSITAVNTAVVRSAHRKASTNDAHAAWLFRMKPAGLELDTLLDAVTYTSVSLE